MVLPGPAEFASQLGQLAAALSRPAAQQPTWPVPDLLRVVREVLTAVAGVTTPGEIDRLRTALAGVARGEAFLLQGGDCAETFADNTTEHIDATVHTLRRVGEVLRRASGLPVVVMARLAGQYAKPRTYPLDAAGLPSYRGDAVHSPEPTARARRPDPSRMLGAYAHARATLLRLRAHGDPPVFASHEALLLDYESALVRWNADGESDRAYDVSAHSLWVGDRTRRPDGAHIAFAASPANPVAVKLGPTATPDEALEYMRVLDPDGVPGRLTFISRMGCEQVGDRLTPIVAKVAATGRPVVWQCDPMHGNTRISANGYKTRDLDRVVTELRGYFEVHRALGTHPGGVHLELTGDDVTECVGGRVPVGESDLALRYRTACDPRLNARQTDELAGLLAVLLRDSVPVGHGSRTR